MAEEVAVDRVQSYSLSRLQGGRGVGRTVAQIDQGDSHIACQEYRVDNVSGGR